MGKTNPLNFVVFSMDLRGMLFVSAEGGGFEPPVHLTTDNGFRDRRIRPLCHPSLNKKNYLQTYMNFQRYANSLLNLYFTSYAPISGAILFVRLWRRISKGTVSAILIKPFSIAAEPALIW